MRSLILLAALCTAAVQSVQSATTVEPWRAEADQVFDTPGNKVGDGPAPTAQDNEVTDCRLDDGTDGECVVYYQCDSASKKLITDGVTLIDVRIKDGPCPKYLEVCCGRHQVNHTKPVVPVGGNGQCGYTNPGASEDGFRISGTEYADFAEFPWMLAVLKKTTANIEFSPKNYIGGASLIHPRVALTSGHKVEGLEPSELRVRAGEFDTQTEQEVYPFQEVDVEKIVIHEDFYRPSVLNSVALLFLAKPFALAPHVDVVCLGHALPPPGTICFSMGWGKENFGNADKYAVLLKKVPLPVVTREKCQNALRGTRLGSYFTLHNSFMCAGGKAGVDTCKGDGGSPLVCPIGVGRFAQVGTVAWGIGCGDNNVPGVYTDVTRFRGWITEQMRAEQLPTDGFEYT